MTLATHFVIDEPHLLPNEVHAFCNLMLEAPDTIEWRHELRPRSGDNPCFLNEPWQGLPALLFVYYGIDGPLLVAEYDGNYNEIGKKEHEPHGYIDIVLDTAYSYSDGLGRNCGQLHASYIAILGTWCEQNGWSYAWQNEFTGEWFGDWRLAAQELGSKADEVASWFRNIVVPALQLETGGALEL